MISGLYPKQVPRMSWEADPTLERLVARIGEALHPTQIYLWMKLAMLTCEQSNSCDYIKRILGAPDDTLPGDDSRRLK